MDQLVEWLMKQKLLSIIVILCWSLSFLRSEERVKEKVANDTGLITTERSIEQVEENISHSPSKEEASSFVASKVMEIITL